MLTIDDLRTIKRLYASIAEDERVLQHLNQKYILDADEPMWTSINMQSVTFANVNFAVAFHSDTPLDISKEASLRVQRAVIKEICLFLEQRVIGDKAALNRLGFTWTAKAA